MMPARRRGGKWSTLGAVLYYAAVRHPNNSDYLSEGDWYDLSMTEHTEELWNYMGAYPEFWLEKTGHSMSNRPGVRDVNGILYDDYGIDGLRCDFAQGLPPQFWEYIVNRTRATKWNFMFMAESLDGGIVSYRSNRHFDILNESFVFQMVGAGSPGDVKNAVESRKSAYSGGAVLLNLTSHDEIMPYSDPWVTASRFAMVSSVMGLPMTFYGQEQGMSLHEMSGKGKDRGRAISTMGLLVRAEHGQMGAALQVEQAADLGQPAQCRLVASWCNGMAVNWARLNSPALQSGHSYFLVAGQALMTTARFLPLPRWRRPARLPRARMPCWRLRCL